MSDVDTHKNEVCLMDDIERRVIALESQSRVVERLEAQINGLDEKVDKLLSVTGSIEVFKSAHTYNRNEVAKLDGAIASLAADVNQVSRDVLAKWSMARGIISAGMIFFAILQAMLVVMWTDVVDRVEADHEVVMAIQHRHETEQQFQQEPGG